MQIEYEGKPYDFTMDEITVKQAGVIKNHCGMTLRGLEDGLSEGDSDALTALFWLMLQGNGDQTRIENVDFKIIKFARAVQEATERENKAQEEREAAEKKAGRRKAAPTNPTPLSSDV